MSPEDKTVSDCDLTGELQPLYKAMPTPIYFNKHYLPMLQMTPAFGFKTRATMDAAQVSHKTQRQYSKNEFGVVQGATATQ